MKARNPAGHLGRLFAGAGQRGHGPGQRLVAVGRGRGEVAGDAEPVQRQADAKDVFDGQLGVVKGNAAETVHLDVDETGGEPGQFLARGGLIQDRDVANPAVADHDSNRLPRIISSSEHAHGNRP